MTDEQLADELNRLGVPFLRGERRPGVDTGIDPARFVAGLAMSDEARLRLAIIPLLLVHPKYAASVAAASRILSDRPRLVLECYYTAAMLLQREHSSELAQWLGSSLPLQDLFSATLGLRSTGELQGRLRALAARQAKVSGDAINWLGTYNHAVEVLLRQLERNTVWTT